MNDMMENLDDSDYIPLYMQGKYNNENNKIENKPESERKCFAYQTEWLKTRDPQVWEDWVALVFNYTRSLVLKKLAKKKFLEKDEVDSATADATFSFMAQYLKPTRNGGQFEVGASFAGMINYKILEALYRKPDKAKYISINTVSAYDDNRELGDTLKELQVVDNYDNIFGYNLSDIIIEVYDAIDRVYPSIEEKIRLKAYVNLLFLKPLSVKYVKSYMSKYNISEESNKFIISTIKNLKAE